MAINQDMIRAYLLREIATRNKIISGFLGKQSGNEYNVGFNEILHHFAGGKNAEVLTIINEHKETKEGKRFASYNYFDIDTLISYNEFLESIVSWVGAVTKRKGHRRSTILDYREGLDNAKKQLVETRQATRANGYYNKLAPIKLAYRYKDGQRELYPVATPSQEAFNRRYNVYTCRKEVELYLEQKLKTLGKSVQGASSKTSKQIELEYFDYKHKGKHFKLVVDKKEYYCDAEGSGLKYIEASGKEGQLFGTYRVDGSVYQGDLYDSEGVIVEVDGGGEVFYERTPQLQSSLYKFDKDDEDQLTFM